MLLFGHSKNGSRGVGSRDGYLQSSDEQHFLACEWNDGQTALKISLSFRWLLDSAVWGEEIGSVWIQRERLGRKRHNHDFVNAYCVVIACKEDRQQFLGIQKYKWPQKRDVQAHSTLIFTSLWWAFVFTVLSETNLQSRFL